MEGFTHSKPLILRTELLPSKVVCCLHSLFLTETHFEYTWGLMHVCVEHIFFPTKQLQRQFVKEIETDIVYIHVTITNCRLVV